MGCPAGDDFPVLMRQVKQPKERTMISDVAREETYMDVKRLLCKICWNNICCCQFEDRLSAAHVAFARAYNSYDPTKGCFSTLVTWAVQNELKTQCKQCRNNARKNTYDNSIVDNSPAPSSNLDEMLQELSEDAQRVVGIILEAPGDVSALMMRSRNPMALVRDMLVRNGWAMDRITNTFSELTGAFGGRRCQEA